MANKKRISTVRWSAFWKSFGIVVQKRNRFLRKYRPKIHDYRPLVNLGVTRERVEAVHAHLSRYADPLLFHKFCMFFRRHSDSVPTWCGVTDIDAAFERLYRIFVRNSLKDLKNRFRELELVSQLNQKGEGRRYEIRYRGIGSLRNIRGRQFTTRLNRNDANSRYQFIDTFRHGGATILAMRRRDGNRDVYKFIKLERIGSTVSTRISADSKSEIHLIRNTLRDFFESYVDTPQIDASLDPLRSFLSTGESDNFYLMGVTYLQGDYRINVAPQFGRTVNVASQVAYQEALHNQDAENILVRYQVSHKDMRARRPVSVDILTPRNHKILGAVMFNVNDRRLSSSDRALIEGGFSTDFGVELNTFISYTEPDTKNILRRLLSSVGQRTGDFHLRSNNALEIYKRLVSDGVIASEWLKLDEPHYCVNRTCSLSFFTQTGRRRCVQCGGVLLPGRAVVSPKVDEQSTAKYVTDALTQLGHSTELFHRKLLRRDLHVVSVRTGSSSVEIVPITTDLTASHVELLRLRFPNAFVLTTKDNISTFSSADIACDHLHEFVDLLYENDSAKISDLLQDISINSLARIRQYASAIETHYSSDQYYVQKNSESKNLGAEFFEAHTFLLFAYLFHNSIWLGAKERGKPMPDGISAFPLTEATRGCLLWDSKFSQGKPNLGKSEKNQRYISAAKRNDTVKAHGGLGSFIFVGNQDPPAGFKKGSRYRKLGTLRKPKIVYIKASSLLLLYRHYRQYEQQILSHGSCQEIFLNLVKRLLFSTAGGQKVFVIDEARLNELLADNAAQYALSAEGTLAAV